MPATKLSKKVNQQNEWKTELLRTVKGGRAVLGLKNEDLSKAIGSGASCKGIADRLRDPDKFKLGELVDLFKAVKVPEDVQKKIVFKRFGWSE
jgi:hypothetical protein